MASLSKPELFGTATRTATLIVISMLGETHAAEVARILARSRSRIKEAADSLELAGVIVGTQVGGSRRLRLNSRFVAADELRLLLAKLGAADVGLQKRLSELRRRPRRAGKLQ